MNRPTAGTALEVHFYCKKASPGSIRNNATGLALVQATPTGVKISIRKLIGVSFDRSARTISYLVGGQRRSMRVVTDMNALAVMLERGESAFVVVTTASLYRAPATASAQ